MKTNSDPLADASINEMIKKMNLIFFALMSGIFMFLLISLYLVEVTKAPTSSEVGSTLLMVVPFIAISCSLAAYFLSNSMLKKARTASNETKIAQYQSAYLVRYSLLEGPSIFSIVGYYLSGNRLFLVILAIVWAVMAINKPSISKYRKDMGELV
jgi:hypothetical protein